MKSLLIILCIALLTACSQEQEHTPLTGEREIGQIEQIIESTSFTIGDADPVPRALVAKMVSLAFYDTNTIHGMDIEMNFSDISHDEWYAGFINTAYTMGIMGGEDEKFSPYEPLTLSQMQGIIDNMYEGNNIRLVITDETAHTPVSYAVWNQMFIRILEGISGDTSVARHFGIQERSIVVLATEENNPRLAGGNIITATGTLTALGMDLNPFLDMEIRVLEKSGEIVSMLSVQNTVPTVENVFVVGNNSESITIFSGGVERTYSFANTLEDKAGAIATVEINAGTVINATFHTEIVENTTIQRVHDNFIELQGLGRVNLGSNFKVYTITYGDVRWRTPRALIVGTDIAQFVKNDGVIVAAIINDTGFPHDIRVAIGTTNFAGLNHTAVELSGDTGLVVSNGFGETRTFSSGEVVRFAEHSDLLGGDRVYISPQGNGRIQIRNITRNWGNNESPFYRGVLEVAWEDPGFSIINELPMDEYLFAVIPSEMPSSFGVDASKAQAITARSFAHNQFFENRFHRMGANVDDSVFSQVYNNIPENAVSIQAATETSGMFLTYNGSVISANFFSTSAGVTANSGDVWAGARNRLDTTTPTFLQSVRHYHNDDFGDLSQEDNARRFFNATIDSYDNVSPWVRWNVQMTAQQVAASINRNLETRYNANPFLIKTLQSDGRFRSKPITTIGDLVNIEVSRRGSGGNIMELIVTGTENTILIITEFNIRSLLAPQDNSGSNVVLTRADNTIVNNFSMMPSSFFTMERLTDGDTLLHVRFIGGGFGHGAGMSQYGAKGKLQRGYSVVEVLEHFYTGAKVERI